MSRTIAGRYEVLAPLGASATSDVFRVRDRLGGSIRALKILRRFRGELWGARLRAEFALLSELDHPGLLGVHDFGIADGDRLFLVMDHVAAAPLERVVAACRDPLVLEEIAARAAEVLEYLDGAGLAHGDVKPANLLVVLAPGAPGGVKELRVADLGLAAYEGAAHDPALLAGTAEFLAPERFLGAGPSPRSDLFSLGLTLRVFAGVGAPPVARSPSEVAEERLRGAIARSADVRPDLAPRFARALDALLARDPRDRPACAGMFLREIGRAAYAAPRRLHAPELIGRDGELSAMEQAARGAAPATVQAHVVTGETGSGKTRLLCALSARLLVAGWRVIGAGRFAGSELATLLAGAEAAPPGGLDASASGSGPLSEALLEEIASLPLDTLRAVRFRRIAEQLESLVPEGRLAVIADDAEQLDPESAAFLAHLVRRPGRLAVVVVLALGDRGAPGRADALIAAAASAGRVVDHDLAPLGEAETERLLESILGTRRLPEGLLAEVRERVGGSPLLAAAALGELVRRGALAPNETGWRYTEGSAAALSDAELPELPERVLSEAARRTLADASVLAHPFDIGLVRELRARPDADILRDLREAARAGVLTEERGAVSPRHIWRSGAARARFGAALEPQERHALHARALDALAARRRAGVPVPEEELAAHALAIGDTDGARALLREGAERAVAELALTRALDLFRRLAGMEGASAGDHLGRARLAGEQGRFDEALSACDAARVSLGADVDGASAASAGGGPPRPDATRVEILRHTAWVHVTAGRPAVASAILEEALALAGDRAPRAATRAGLLIDLGWALARQGAYTAAAERLRAASRVAPPRDPLQAIARNRLAVCLLYLGDEAEARRVLRSALALVAGEHPPIEAALLGNIAFAERRRGRLAAALEHRDRAEAIWRRTGQVVLLIDSALERTLILRKLGRTAEALSVIEWAISENRALGREPANGPPLLSRGALLEFAGRWDEAEASYRAGLVLLEQQNDAANWVAAHNLLGELAAKRGDLESAEREYGRAREIAARSEYRLGRLVAKRNDGFLHACRGDAVRALAVLSEAAREMAKASLGAWVDETLALQGGAAVDAGDFGAARAALGQAARAQRRRPTPRVGGMIARARARLLEAAGRTREALAAARRAASLSRDGADVHEVALSCVVLARLEARCGSPRRAREAAAEAREIFERCGARPGLDSVDALSLDAPAVDATTSEDFEAICRVMRTVAAIREPDRLLDAMLDVALEHLSAERGFVVLYSGGSGQHEVRAARDITRESADELARVSRRILAAAGAGPTLVASDRAIDDPRFRDAPSVIAHNILSVICAPLSIAGRALGFIYVDNRRRTSPFSAADRRFVEAFALQAAFALERANEIRSLETALRVSRSDPVLVGKSPAVQRVLQLVDRAAEMDHLPVFITGENGTGKELVAGMLQSRSPRRGRPFIRVNCAAFSETLIESELFGHERGAFTGAAFARPGIFERAHGGTLFLDEIGEIPQAVQLKLLRVLQELTVTRVGGSKDVRVDVRILSATNADLEQRVAAGLFRPDVFYRLQGLHIHLPPLRERLGDIPDLVRHFLDGLEHIYRRGPLSITQEALDVLQAYSWPGNVRQLEREVHRALALALARGNLIRREDISSAVATRQSAPAPSPERTRLRERIESTERQTLRQALVDAGWVNTRAARALGVTEGAIRKKIKKYGLSREL
jgi:transcriptional regulator with GAF, ATPase, and Fis domain/ATP/maltotriose-dependent transcriptional regulator MalT